MNVNKRQAVIFFLFPFSIFFIISFPLNHFFCFLNSFFLVWLFLLLVFVLCYYFCLVEWSISYVTQSNFRIFDYNKRFLFKKLFIWFRMVIRFSSAFVRILGDCWRLVWRTCNYLVRAKVMLTSLHWKRRCIVESDKTWHWFLLDNGRTADNVKR